MTTIFTLIDALGWRYIEGEDFLSDVLVYRTPLRTVLGFSSGAIPTILTGLPPARNGHWNLFYHDPGGSPFRWLRHFGFLPNRVLNHRVARKVLKEMGRHVLGLGRNFECSVSPRLLPWFNYVEKRNIYDHHGISGANSIFDVLAEKGVPHHAYSYHHWTDQEIVRQAKRDLEVNPAGFFFLYLSEMDAFLHRNCADGRKIQERLQWYADQLHDLFELAAKLSPEVTFTVVSDHGMTPVRHHYDLVAQIDRLGLASPGQYLAVYDSTMARFWFFCSQASEAVRQCLEQQACGRILSDSELDELGIFFPDRRYGELIFLLHPGWLISHSDFNGPGWMPLGMHGYHPDDPCSDALFLSNRRPSLEVRTIADVYNCMLEAAA